MGQLSAQLPAGEPCHSMWGEDLHDTFCLFGGTVPHMHHGGKAVCKVTCAFLFINCRWRSVPDLQSSLRTSAWSSTPEKQSYPAFSLFTTFLAQEVCDQEKGEWSCHFSVGTVCALPLTLYLLVFRSCLTGVYEVSLFRMLESGGPAGMQRRCRRALDASLVHEHGEGTLAGWRPPSDSLIFDHRWELDKLSYLHDVRTSKHKTMDSSVSSE